MPEVPESWTFTFPEGDPEDGKAVFMRMECYSCHAINVPGEKLPAESGGIGPALTPGYSKLPAAYLAESIIKAHTVVAAPGYELKARADQPLPATPAPRASSRGGRRRGAGGARAARRAGTDEHGRHRRDRHRLRRFARRFRAGGGDG